jgi:predicted ATP-dependent serine protease
VSALGNEVVFLTDFDTETNDLQKTYGTTPLYSTGSADLDKYLCGGYGRPGGYEIVVLFGATGIGKSTLALNLIIEPIKKGAKVGLLMLEDDGPDVNAKIRKLFGGDFSKYREQIHFTPAEVVDGSKLWGLDELLVLIESWFTDRGLDIIILDPLQFAFESAIAIKGENEYISQRIFVRRINYLVRKLNKTIILVSHIGKNNQAKGMDRIIGSSGIAGSATKTIEIKKDGGLMLARYWKSRFTPTPDHDRAFKFDGNHLIIGPNDRASTQQVPF